MSFKNMSPADRMKASGLIGLIVVIVFFALHTVLGAVSPKKPTTTPPGGTASGTAPAPAPGGPVTAGGAPGGPAGTPAMWPATQIAKNGPDLKSSIFMQDPEDPFEPLPGSKQGPNSKPAPRMDPPVQIDPGPSFGGNNAGPLPWPGAGRPAGNPGMPFGGSPSGPQTVAVPVQSDPEIRLIGFVHGDPPVATVMVSGRNMIVRPGDPLAKGWRLMGVDSEGVTIRHSGEMFTLKTGGVLNEPDGKPRL
jgi:hypothetical protein